MPLPAMVFAAGPGMMGPGGGAAGAAMLGPAAGAVKVAARVAMDYAPTLSSVSLASVLAKEAWKRIPSWIKDDVAFPGTGGKKNRTKKKKSKGAKGNEYDEEGDDNDDDTDDETTTASASTDETEMASLTAVVQKLQSLMAVGSEKLAQDADSATTSTSTSTETQLHAAVLAYIQLAAQLKLQSPETRDDVYKHYKNTSNQNTNNNQNTYQNTNNKDKSDQEKEDEDEAVDVDWLVLQQALDFAVWAYDEDTCLLQSKLEEIDYYLLQHKVVAPNMPPGYVGHYIAISPQAKVMVIGIKGTSTLEDMLTDCCGQAVAFELDAGSCPFPQGHSVSNEDILCVQGGVSGNDNDNNENNGNSSSVEVCLHNGLVIRCHEGILISARRLAKEVMPLLMEHEHLFQSSSSEGGGYKIVIAGHSLGAAVASLLAILIRSRIPSLTLSDADTQLLQVFAFACPPVLDHDAAIACAPFTTTIVNNSDIIPRSSMANLRTFLQFLQVVNQKLVERGMGLGSPKAALKLIRKLSRGTGGDLLMSQQEVTDAMTMAHDRIGLLDQQHLYLPGRVIVMYENWKQPDDNLNAIVNSTGGGEDGDQDDRGGDDDDDKGPYINIEHCVVADGTMKALRFFEIDKSRMITDHLTASYYNSVNALVSKEQQQQSKYLLVKSKPL
jgi:hypothetical protein